MPHWLRWLSDYETSTYERLLRGRGYDPPPPCVLLRQLFVESEEVGETSHHAELAVLERLHVRAREHSVRQKAEVYKRYFPIRLT